MKRFTLLFISSVLFIPPLYSQGIFIPDTLFLHALIAQGVDTNQDSSISYSEAEAVSILDVSSLGIKDMTGIGEFLFLERLNCSANQLTFLDLSSIRTLVAIDCQDNDLANLDVTNNTGLVSLWCANNHLTALDVTRNVKLKILDVGIWQSSGGNDSLGNNLSRLDLSMNPDLEFLSCNNNLLKSLDISHNPNLREIWLVEIESLFEVCVWTTPFPPEGVDLYRTGSPNIYYTTDCSPEPGVFIPDLNFLHALLDEGVDSNQDSLISFSEAEAVTSLDIQKRNISDMTGIEAFVHLESLICKDNPITGLDLSKCKGLKSLNCQYCELDSLDVSANSALEELNCSYILLSSLNVSGNEALERMDCSWNVLYSLDLSGNPELKHLHCHANQLSSLDLSDNPLLTELRCGGNPLDDLDVSENPALEKLRCDFNRLSSLNITGNSALLSLNCNHNQLTTLDISNNISLTELHIELMPSLTEVCVWETPFPPESLATFSDTGSFNAYYTTECAYGIEDFTPSGFSIHPNPAGDMLIIEALNAGKYSIQITSINGELLFQADMEGASHHIDLSSFKRGILFITIRANDIITSEKIMKL